MLTPAELEALAQVDPELAEELAEALLAEQSPRWSKWCPHNPLPKQLAFIQSPAREILYGGAGGGGKSDALLMKALSHVDKPGFNGIIFRRTYTELALPEAIMARSHEWLAGSAAHWNGEIKQWEFPSGSTLGFAYLEGPRDHFRYQGAAWQFMGWDELTQFTEPPYRYLFSRRRRLVGQESELQFAATCNPGGIGHDWVKSRWGIPDEIDFTQWYEYAGRIFMPARKEDNPYLDQEGYEQSLRELDSVTYAQIALGKWVHDPSMIVYPEFTPDNIIEKLPPLPDGVVWQTGLACDFGVVDKTAFVAIYTQPHDPNCYVVESEQWQGMAPHDAAIMAREWSARHHGFDWIVGDIGGLGKAYQVEWQRRFHLPLEPAEKQNKLGFIKLLNGDFKAKRVRIVRGSNIALIDNLRMLPWEDEKHKREHPAADNHLTDGVLYGWRKAKHYMATEKPETLEPGSPAYITEQMRKEKAEALSRVAKEQKKKYGKLTQRELIQLVRRM